MQDHRPANRAEGHSIQANFSLRPYTPADAPAVVEVINADAEHTLGIRRAVVDGAGNVRMMRYVPPTSQQVVATTADNLVIGYAYLADRDYSIVTEVGGAVHPAYWRKDVGTLLLQWAERQAIELAGHAPGGIRAVLQSNVFQAERPAIRLLTRQGFTKVREWVHMEVELDAPPPPSAAPDGMLIRPMDLDSDWDRVGPAMDQAYAGHWGTISLSALESITTDEESPEDSQDSDPPQDLSYSNSPGYCFVLMEGDTVVGGVLCNARLVERDDTGRVGSMFVIPHYRRRGAGRALMLAAFNAFWQRGVRRIILDTDASSLTDAPKFYMSLGMQVYRRELLYEKEIRPGREVRRLAL